ERSGLRRPDHGIDVHVVSRGEDQVLLAGLGVDPREVFDTQGERPLEGWTLQARESLLDVSPLRGDRHQLQVRHIGPALVGELTIRREDTKPTASVWPELADLRPRPRPEPSVGEACLLDAARAFHGSLVELFAGTRPSRAVIERHEPALRKGLTCALADETVGARAHRMDAVVEQSLSLHLRDDLDDAAVVQRLRAACERTAEPSYCDEAQALAAEAQALVTALAGEVHDLGLVLGRETGERVSVPLRTRGPYPDPPLPPEAELRRRFDDLGALPEVALRRLRARAALARADESAAAGGTRLTTGLSVQRESNRDVLLYGVVGVTIPLVDRNQREQATARAEARRHEAEAELHEVELSARLQVALHDLHHTEQQMATLRDQTIPALDELVLARDLALEQGEGTRALLLQTRRRRHEAARALARAEGEWILARVQVWLYLEAFASAEGPR
ncbi:MAG: TolC family protein, partial [Myxococcales bacterium]|nr:TolC family protein [Myxococcales bacterium]